MEERTRAVSGSRVLVLIERPDRSRYFEAALPLLRSAGVEVALATVLPEGPLHKALRRDGFPVTALDCGSAAEYPVAATRFARIIRRERPGLIASHEAIPTIVAGLARALPEAREPRLVMHRHHAEVSGAQRVFSRIASALADSTLAVSQAALEAAVAADHVSPERASVAWNGIADLRPSGDGESRDLRGGLGISPEGTMVLAVARLRPEKGLLTLIGALSRLDRDDVDLVVVGDGPDASAVETEVRRRGLGDRVHLIGFRGDVAPWYRAADVVAIPSLAETFGLVAIEAAAASRPVIASNVGGLREIVIDGETGSLTPPGEAVSFGRAIVRLADDPAARTRLGAAARERYEHLFTVEAMVERWLDCYEVALARR